MGVGKRAHQFRQIEMARCPGTRSPDQPADSHDCRTSSVGAHCHVASRKTPVSRGITRRIPGRACLPHRNDEVAVSISAEALVSLTGCFLVIQNVPGHRAIRSDEIDRLAIALVAAPGWSGAGCLAV